MDEKEYLTQEKHDELKDELVYLTSTKRKEVAEKLEYAKSLGDLSENAEYQEARDAQGQIEERIARIESVLSRAEIVSHKKSDDVRVGSSTTLEKVGSKEPHVYMLVGSEESNMAEGKISDQSPLGSAMIGKKKGDTFFVTTPGGKVEYEVIDIK